jgi:membrane protein
MKVDIKRMLDFVSKTVRFMTVGMWTVDESKLSKTQVALVNMSKIIHVTVKKFLDYNIPMQAGTCTYITTIALIPIMLVVLSILKVFGVFNDRFFGEIAKNSSGTVIPKLVELFQTALNSTAGIGGIVGLVFFIILAFSTFNTLETTFNTIWGTTKKRVFYRQLTDYMFLIIVIPVILSAGIFVYYKIATFGFSPFVSNILRILTIFVAVWASLFMFYKIMPNAQVQVRPVMIGAVVVALAFALLIWAVQTGIVGIGRLDVNNIQARILGPMAILPISLIFFNILWMIVLIGGILIFSIQSLKGYTGGDEFAKISQKMRLAVVLTCLAYLAKSFYAKAVPPDIVRLGELLKVHPNFIHSGMRILAKKNIVGCVDGQRNVYALIVDPAATRISEVMAAVNEEAKAFYDVQTPLVRSVGLSVVRKVEDSLAKSPANITLRQLMLNAKLP